MRVTPESPVQDKNSYLFKWDLLLVSTSIISRSTRTQLRRDCADYSKTSWLAIVILSSSNTDSETLMLLLPDSSWERFQLRRYLSSIQCLEPRTAPGMFEEIKSQLPSGAGRSIPFWPSGVSPQVSPSTHDSSVATTICGSSVATFLCGPTSSTALPASPPRRSRTATTSYWRSVRPLASSNRTPAASTRMPSLKLSSIAHWDRHSRHATSRCISSRRNSSTK